MRHITLQCPNCGHQDKAVGDPDEHKNGWEGSWYCFYCNSSGTYVMEFTTLKGADPVA